MLTQGFGEVITDILTINPIVRTISSASAILDASNFTFNAVSLGKDAEGFQFHAHAVSTPTITFFPSLSINNDYVLILRGNTVSPSSYHTSATYNLLSSTYNSVPQFPSIYDKRLENNSTLSYTELLVNLLSPVFKDLGQYVNLAGATNSSLSSIWNAISPYPPSGNVGKYLMLDNAGGTFVTSGQMSGVFNTLKIVDVSGFIKINEAINVTSTSGGPYITSSSDFATNPAVILGIKLGRGDAVGLALFGGVKHIGIWCLDLKEMLKVGLNPPYSWDNLNNNRKYKLVGKVTFWDDILYQEDNGGSSGLSLLDTNGILIKLRINFK